MRSGLSQALMGVGGILLSFSFTIIVIGLFARMNTNTQWEMHAITRTATLMVAIGGAMFVGGYLLSRIGRERGDYSGPERVSS
ncbi:MAG TPA: hypothetical protein VGG76_08240 [Gemmatimonadaceae bacterium]|jgi:hypothetical protein